MTAQFPNDLMDLAGYIVNGVERIFFRSLSFFDCHFNLVFFYFKDYLINYACIK